MPHSTLSPQDWTLLAIHSAGSRGLTPVQLQKALFLLGKELPRKVGTGFYEFSAYNYGPFSRQIYKDADALADAGLVVTQRHEGQRWNDYVISPDGTNASLKVRVKAPEDAVKYLDKVVQWACSLSFGDLVRAIYRKYPEYQENSVFNG